MGFAESKPEATSIRTADLLHLCDRAPVARALCRLAHSERLLRVCRGVYMLPIQTRIGIRAPRREKALTALAKLWEETIVPNVGDVANRLMLYFPCSRGRSAARYAAGFPPERHGCACGPRPAWQAKIVGMVTQCVGVPITTASMSGSSSNRRKSVSTVGPVSCRAATDETA